MSCRAKRLLRGAIFRTSLRYAEVLLRDCAVGDRVAIVGAGGIGADVAHYLSFGESDADESTRFLYEQGLAAPPDGALLIRGRKAVALMRRGPTIGERIGKTTRWAVLRALRAAGVETLANVTYDAVVPGGIRVRTADAHVRTIEADTIVIAAGQERNDALLEPITKRFAYRFESSAGRTTRASSTRCAPSKKDCAPRTSSIASLEKPYRLTCTRKPSDGRVNAGSDAIAGERAKLWSLAPVAIRISVPVCCELSFPQAPALIAQPLAYVAFV